MHVCVCVRACACVCERRGGENAYASVTVFVFTKASGHCEMILLQA